MTYQSIRSYLSAVRHWQIMNGLPDPAWSSFPRLDYVLKGIRRSNVGTPRPRRLPITPTLLRRIHQEWSRHPPSYDHTMLWAAFCLGFFAFMRAGEFTCPSHQAFTGGMLTVGDFAVDSHSSPSHLVVRLRQSKTDPFGAGLTIHLGATGDNLCPIAAMLGYLAVRPSTPGPIFLFSDGSTLSKPRLIRALRQVLQQVGVDDSSYSGHSFRIGAATTAAQVGMSDALIKTLGRWKSTAYSLYIHTPLQELTSVSANLVRV